MQISLNNLNDADLKCIIGASNTNVKILEDIYNCQIEVKGNNLFISKDDDILINNIKDVFEILCYMESLNLAITKRDIIYITEILKQNKKADYLSFIKRRKAFTFTYDNKPIFLKTIRQELYLKTLEEKDLTFSIGSAGSGKTFLAVALAVKMLKKRSCEKIILSRPAVEAGESLGYLPGDLKEKVDPYLRPLYDALYEMLGQKETENLINKGVIEIAPLAYMRGRTLDNAFVILDEAQNASLNQLKMFLTRLGFNSKMVVTGDISQVDLKNKNDSGLKKSIDLLKNIKGVGIIEFEKEDVIRHPLVQKIIEQFEKN
ncbi:MAG: PhoH family protein [Acholeplasmatales bacterium]|nr:PhoH family protein [Acholeplasmatales bacterium]